MTRNNIKIMGPVNGPVVMLAHESGCDHGTWDKMLPHFTEKHRVSLFDHVGFGGSDLAAEYSVKSACLHGYARDVPEICKVPNLQDVTRIAHSVRGMMEIDAVDADTLCLDRLLLGASPAIYLENPTDGDIGGLSAKNLDGLLSSLHIISLIWTTLDTLQNAAELQNRFLGIIPMVAREFCRVAFLSDVRPLLRDDTSPSLVLQCIDDLLASDHIGLDLQKDLADGTLLRLTDTGHCPQVSSPEESAHAIRGYLKSAAACQQTELELIAAS
ncbi:alpha/beta fold hydrolase [Paeniglutamicibacter terrestris]|uniref:Alpha/beta hydrolase n=1 Tax=Paeniglutamicibacter terrestris TaxID=2723403 RepID=A0ABX1GB49_9MICC|nr:alpha/beta hydrolase [Paeniglutamicibacter terrestris]NKG22592.1 alpha/beta hydrolase [Paeniglutamicibacter terrestris]